MSRGRARLVDRLFTPLRAQRALLDAFFAAIGRCFAERCSFVLSSGPRCRHHYMTRINVARGHGDGVVAGALGQRAREREDDVGHEHAGEARRLRSRHLWHKRGIGHWALGIGHWALGIGHWVCLEPTRTVVGIGEGVRRPVRGDGDSRLRRAKYGGGGGEEPQRQARHRGYRHPLEPHTLSCWQQRRRPRGSPPDEEKFEV